MDRYAVPLQVSVSRQIVAQEPPAAQTAYPGKAHADTRPALSSLFCIKGSPLIMTLS